MGKMVADACWQATYEFVFEGVDLKIRNTGSGMAQWQDGKEAGIWRFGFSAGATAFQECTTITASFDFQRSRKITSFKFDLENNLCHCLSSLAGSCFPFPKSADCPQIVESKLCNFALFCTGFRSTSLATICLVPAIAG
jgi:hypothetical protein